MNKQVIYSAQEQTTHSARYGTWREIGRSPSFGDAWQDLKDRARENLALTRGRIVTELVITDSIALYPRDALVGEEK